jgi:hypothetical protein
MNFYDFAQLKNLDTGLFEDVEVNLAFPLAVDPLETMNQPLEIPSAEWKNRYKKVEYNQAEKYRFAVYFNDSEDAQIISESNPNLTSAGLKTNVSEITRFRLLSFQPGDAEVVFYEGSLVGGLFPPIDTLFQKVTSEPNVEAEQVELNLDGTKPINVFLNQSVFTIYGFVQREVGGYIGTIDSFVADYDTETLWFQPSGTEQPSSTDRQAATERKLETFLGSDFDYFDFREEYSDGETKKYLSWTRSKVLPLYEETTDYPAAAQTAVDLLISDYGGRVYNAYLARHLASTVYYHIHTFPADVIFTQLFWYSGAEFPYNYPLLMSDFPGGIGSSVDPPLEPTVTQTNEFPVDEAVNLTPEIQTFPDTLLAAFEQNGQFFYVWARNAEL